MDTSILTKQFKEILAQGNIVGDSFVAHAQNLQFDWEHPDQTIEETKDRFFTIPEGVVDGDIFINNKNYIDFKLIERYCEILEEIAVSTNKIKLKIFFSLIYVSCKVSEISEIFREEPITDKEVLIHTHKEGGEDD